MAHALVHEAAPSAEGLYVPLDAAPLLQDRQKTPELAAETVRFAAPEAKLLKRLLAQPMFISRLGTPSFEVLRFLEMTKRMARPSLIIEIAGDYFTPAVNSSKANLGKLRVVIAKERGGASRHHGVQIVRFDAPGRKLMNELICFDGTPFVQFHNQLLAHVAGKSALRNVLPCGFLGSTPREHYERIFALSTCFGVMVESFAFSGAEERFTHEVALPAYEATVARFGAQPIVVRLLPPGGELDPYWESYPLEVMPLAKRAAGR